MWQGDKGHCDHGTKWFERGTQMAKNEGGGPCYLAMALTLHAQIRNKQLRAAVSQAVGLFGIPRHKNNNKYCNWTHHPPRK